MEDEWTGSLSLSSSSSASMDLLDALQAYEPSEDELEKTVEDFCAWWEGKDGNTKALLKARLERRAQVELIVIDDDDDIVAAVAPAHQYLDPPPMSSFGFDVDDDDDDLLVHDYKPRNCAVEIQQIVDEYRACWNAQFGDAWEFSSSRTSSSSSSSPSSQQTASTSTPPPTTTPPTLAPTSNLSTTPESNAKAILREHLLRRQDVQKRRARDKKLKRGRR